MDKRVYEILGKYVDLSYKSEHKNVVGINVEQYFDGMDYRTKYVDELAEIGFNIVRGLYDPYCTELFSEKLLCCVSYCEGDLQVVWYKDEKEYLSELNRN